MLGFCFFLSCNGNRSFPTPWFVALALLSGCEELGLHLSGFSWVQIQPNFHVTPQKKNFWR